MPIADEARAVGLDAHTDLRSISRVRPVPIAPSTRAPTADAGPVRPRPDSRRGDPEGFSQRHRGTEGPPRASHPTRIGRQEWSRDREGTQRNRSGTLDPFRPGSRDEEEVSRGGLRALRVLRDLSERTPKPRRRRSCSSGPWPSHRRSGSHHEEHEGHEEAEGTKKQRTRRRGDRQVGSPLGTDRAGGRQARGSGLWARASRRLGLRALRVLRGESCLDGSAGCANLAQGFRRRSRGERRVHEEPAGRRSPTSGTGVSEREVLVHHA
jgi:hypothetical protein